MKHHELSGTFQGNLKAVRKLRGYSQCDLAVLLETSQRAVSNWESGMNSPTLRTVEKLAKVLGVEVETLLTPQGIEIFLSAVA